MLRYSKGIRDKSCRASFALRSLILLASSMVLAACASPRLALGPSASEVREHALSADEAGTMLAELVARELDQFAEDSSTVLSRAIRLENGSYRIYYQSADGGGFEPNADVELRRKAFCTAAPGKLLEQLPRSPLGRLSRVPLSRSVQARNGDRYHVDCRVTLLSDRRCRVAIDCRGSILGIASDRVARWHDELAFVARLRRAFDELHSGRQDRGIETLRECLNSSTGIAGHFRPELLRMGHCLLARLEAERRNWKAAERACRQALIFAQDSRELQHMRARIAKRIPGRAQVSWSNCANQMQVVARRQALSGTEAAKSSVIALAAR
jgi:hypothetical protein